MTPEGHFENELKTSCFNSKFNPLSISGVKSEFSSY